MPEKWTRIFGLLGIVAFVTYLFGCSKNGNDTVVGPSPTPARFMFVQASPDAPPVDLYDDSVRVDSNIVYPNSTKYIDFATGVRTLKVVGYTSAVLPGVRDRQQLMPASSPTTDLQSSSNRAQR